jgi:membrane-bound serine protease (ClpP class)
MVDNIGFDPATFRMDGLLVAFFTVISAAFLSIILSFWVGRKVLTSPQMFGNLALNTTQKVSDGYVSAVSEYTEMLGKEGIANSILRPSGKIEIGGDIYDATAETGYIDAGSRVRVVKYSTSQLIVRKIV